MKKAAMGLALTLLAGCASPVTAITAYPPTPNPKVAERFCVEAMMKDMPPLGLIGALATMPSRQQIYDGCMAAHGWRGGD